MTGGFETYLRMHTDLDERDIERVGAAAVRKTLRRNEPLLRQGQVCRHKTFVEEGLLRTFGMAEDGSESILQFATENSWTLDAESYDNQTPSSYHIVAVEHSEVLQWTKSEFDRLLADMPGLRIFAQQLISHNVHSGRQRLFTTLSATPEEKYEDFVKTSPRLLARLPLYMIASYLGMSLKTLTRIRHAQLHR